MVDIASFVHYVGCLSVMKHFLFALGCLCHCIVEFSLGFVCCLFGVYTKPK